MESLLDLIKKFNLSNEDVSKLVNIDIDTVKAFLSNESNEYFPDSPSHPGVTLAEIIHDRNISVADLEKSTNIPITVLTEIITGNLSITPEIANKLEQAFEYPKAEFWINRELDRQLLTKFNTLHEILILLDKHFNTMPKIRKNVFLFPNEEFTNKSMVDFVSGLGDEGIFYLRGEIKKMYEE